MSDALERLRKRQRPTVPIRDTSLVLRNQDTSTSRNLDLNTSEHEEAWGEDPSCSESEKTPDSRTSGYLDNNKMDGLPINQESQIFADTSIQQPTSSDTSTSRNRDIEKLEPSIQPLATKQSTLRLEANLSDRLQSLCREHNICREVLLEAMFEHCEANQETLQQVLIAAQEKNEHRQQIANLKRAQSMMKRFGQIGS